MQAGSAKTIITPPLPVHLVGYSAERRSVEVHDDLAARALVVEHEGRRVALLSAELLWLERTHVRRIREQVQALCGIAPHDLLVVCTHTHAGPDTLGWYDFAPVNQVWLETLLAQLAGTVWLACQRLQPARAELTRGHLPVGINRRQPTADGPRLGEDPGGVYDPTATGLRVLDESGALLASVVHGAAHPVSLGSAECLVSGDWPGLMCRTVEATLGGHCLFVNGACGDVNPQMWGVRGHATMHRIGNRAAGAALELLASDTLDDTPAAAGASRQVRLPHHDHPYLGAVLARRLAADDGLVTETQALRLGPLALISMPGECLTETGWAVQKATQLPNAVVAGYGNDYVGYLPLPHTYAEGGYEPSSTYLPADSVVTLVQEAAAVGDELAGA